MSIGSHGIAHSDLKSLAPDALDTELTRSKATLEAVHGQPVETFSIPFGRYNARVLKAIRKAGYSAAFTSDGGRAQTQSFLRPRRSLRCDMLETEIDQTLWGTTPLLKRLRRALATGVKQLV
jgi:peptidoglycan/xylan/chitin deacetylase (PgdA/CDA1 family)